MESVNSMAISSVNNGSAFQRYVRDFLNYQGLEVEREKVLGKTITGSTRRVDLYCEGIVIECKYQGKLDGTLFQKWAYEILCLNSNPEPSVLVVGSHPELREKTHHRVSSLKRYTEKHVSLMSLEEFVDGGWAQHHALWANA